MIRQAERVFLLVWAHQGAWENTVHVFFECGKFSHAIDDPYYPVNPSLYENALAIILSVSGETEEVLRIASQFSLNKCKIIAVTNSENCSLAK